MILLRLRLLFKVVFNEAATVVFFVCFWNVYLFIVLFDIFMGDCLFFCIF